MITIPNKDFKSSNIMLQQIINSTTKVKMLKVCKKFDLYVSPNLRKDETSSRIALDVMDNPIEILSRLSKTELQILDEFVCGGDDTYVVRKQRKPPLTSSRNIYSLSPIATMKRMNGTCSCLRNFVRPLPRASHSS